MKHVYNYFYQSTCYNDFKVFTSKVSSINSRSSLTLWVSNEIKVDKRRDFTTLPNYKIPLSSKSFYSREPNDRRGRNGESKISITSIVKWVSRINGDCKLGNPKLLKLISRRRHKSHWNIVYIVILLSFQ